ARFEHAFARARDTFVEQQVRVQVAIARMEDVGDRKAVAIGDGVDVGKRLYQLRSRHDAVEDVVVRRVAAERAEGALSPAPEQLTLGRVARIAYLDRAKLEANGARSLDLRLEDVLDPFQLDQQHSPSVRGIAALQPGFG